MGVETMMTILSSYFISITLMIFNQHLTTGLQEPEIDLKTPGILLFFTGITGNLYHHFLLCKLRNEGGSKEYRIPKGVCSDSWFALTTCSTFWGSVDLLSFPRLCFRLHMPWELPVTCWAEVIPLGDGKVIGSMVDRVVVPCLVFNRRGSSLDKQNRDRSPLYFVAGSAVVRSGAACEEANRPGAG
ncbi:putative Double-stranded-RNA-binding protein 4 [Hibiscus syriacus]|uniref:Double-stranded-RNA-binding protein 4 n=1 Tax=Hibiscus syriacus TaxID=106335 RepID=A0A6A2WLS4_HIBSY|nr:putative Double-stranded-RNA-binding protein 4 [Hibiscus syriacus]